MELGYSGEISHLASRIERKMDDFDNSMVILCTFMYQYKFEVLSVFNQILMVVNSNFCSLHKVKQEIGKLMQNKLWERNVMRSPMSCYILQQLFKD